MMLLVLAPRVISADDVRAALPNDDLTGAQVLVVTPAHSESAVAFWIGDVDQAIADAEGSAQRTAEALREAGARAQLASRLARVHEDWDAQRLDPLRLGRQERQARDRLGHRLDGGVGQRQG